MPLLPPGDETGVYYIIIAGLPFDCKWQKLKDFVRNCSSGGIIVDHAMVYENSTDGWVRIVGRSEFLRAMDGLQGAVMDGHRALIPDGRNETQPVHLRDLAPSLEPGVSRTESSSTLHSFTSNTSFPSPSTPVYTQRGNSQWNNQSNYSPVTSDFPIGSYMQSVPPMYQMAPSYNPQQAPEYMITPHHVVLTANITPNPLFVPQSAFCFMPPPTMYSTEYMNSSATPLQPSSYSDSNSVVRTEARKVIFTQLSRSTTESELRELLAKLIARFSSSDPWGQIHHVSIAKYSEGKPKGHAFAVFETHRISAKIVEAANGLRFQGRVLQARFAKEGADLGRRRDAQESEFGSCHVEKLPLRTTTKDSINRHAAKVSASPDWDTTLYGHATTETQVESTMNGSSKKTNKKSKQLVTPLICREASSTPVVVDGSSGRGSGKKKHHSHKEVSDDTKRGR